MPSARTSHKNPYHPLVNLPKILFFVDSRHISCYNEVVSVPVYALRTQRGRSGPTSIRKDGDTRVGAALKSHASNQKLFR